MREKEEEEEVLLFHHGNKPSINEQDHNSSPMNLLPGRVKATVVTHKVRCLPRRLRFSSATTTPTSSSSSAFFQHAEQPLGPKRSHYQHHHVGYCSDLMASIGCRPLSSSSSFYPPMTSSSEPPISFTPGYIDCLEQYLKSFPGPLPLYRNMPPCLSNYRFKPVEIKENGRVLGSKNRQESAVLVPLVNRHGVASLLYTLRSVRVSTFKGHVSFPGGHIEPGETPTEAAMREANEELGPYLGPIRILGECQQLPAVTGTLVTPVLAYLEKDIHDLSHIQPSPFEVSGVFTMDMRQLLNPALRGIENLGPRASHAPFFLGGPQRIWGLTAFITEGVLMNALKPCLAAMPPQTVTTTTTTSATDNPPPTTTTRMSAADLVNSISDTLAGGLIGGMC